MMMDRPVGLITAIPEEVAAFGPHLQTLDEETIAGWRFVKGTLDGTSVVVVEAGCGKVNTAIVATLMAERFNIGGLVFSGVAGALDPRLAIGDAVAAVSLLQHDYGALSGGKLVRYQPGLPPLPGLPTEHGYALPAPLEGALRRAVAEITLPLLDLVAAGRDRRVPEIYLGGITTGDQFINSDAVRRRLFETTGALVVDMESAALAQVAERLGLPWMVLRRVSDLAGSDSHLDFPRFLHAIAPGSALLVRRLMPLITSTSTAAA